MDINRANLNSLFIGFNKKLQEGFGMADIVFETFSMILPSSTAIEKYGWLLLLSRMREWIGPRQIKDIENKIMSLTNKDFEHTIGVAGNDIEDDTLGIYSPLFTQMGIDSRYLWQRLAVEALYTNGNWMDDAAFFLTTRKYGSNTINNKVTTALSESTFETAFQTMEQYLGYDDSPLGVKPNLLVVGPKLRNTAWDIVENPYRYDSSDKVQVANRNKDKVKVQVVPELVGTYDDYWFLMDCRGAVKPVALQKRKEGTLQRWDTEHDECVKNHNRYDYGLHSRGVAGLTLPHLCYGGLKS